VVDLEGDVDDSDMPSRRHHEAIEELYVKAKQSTNRNESADLTFC